MSVSVSAKMNLEHPKVDIGHCLRLANMGEEDEIAHNLVFVLGKQALKKDLSCHNCACLGPTNRN